MVVLATDIPTSGQSLNFARGAPNANIVITSDDGIQWLQDKEVLIATGNAKAVRDKNTIEADVLKFFYKKKKDGGTDIIKLEATGNVKIYSPTDGISGSFAVYDFVKAVAVVWGKKVVYRSGKDTVTANKQMDYTEKDQVVVARGNALANKDGKKIRADTLVARFRPTKKGNNEIYRIEAFKNVSQPLFT